MSDAITPESRDLLALALVPGLGPKLTAALLQRFGSASAARRASAEQLRRVPHIGDKLANDFAVALRDLDVDAELALVARHGVRLLPPGSPEYPAALATIPDPPPLLFVRGSLEPADARAVALVGSRNCSPYGTRTAERIAGGLARAGWTVVSGLAYGIDAAAHRGALEAGGRTLAVLAGGLSRIYPREHTKLADDVAASGALLTESSMKQEPLPGLFPARNRIISGICRAVVVVEANERSGALITAEHAAEQGREVFTVPGNVDSAASAGCLRLLRDGVRPVRNADDIIEDLGGIAPIVAPPAEPAQSADAPTPPPSVEPPGLDPTGQRIWQVLAGQPRHIDELVRDLGMPVAQLSGALMMLEMKKVVRRLPGNQFERRA
jgi:DNA processing protein